MPTSLWTAVENYVPKIKEDRSSWIQKLVTKALGEAGELPDDPINSEVLRLRELVETRGLAAVSAKLDEIEQEVIATAAGGAV